MTDRDDTITPGLSSNVVPIRKNKAKDKISQARVCRMLSDAVRRLPESPLAQFPEHYLTLRPKPGVTVPIRVSSNEEVSLESAQAVADEILKYCDHTLGYNPDFVIKPRLALEAANYFMSVSAPTPAAKIKSVRWADEAGLTYRRLPWSKASGLAPTWERLLSRMTNNQAFIHWIGSLFFEEAYLHNYVWIYGEGGDGKGSISRFLGRVFGDAYCSKSAPTMDRNGTADKFWAYSMLGKRIAVFPDCESATFPTSGLFKSLTGGDPIEVEQKGAMGFTTCLNTRFMVLANVKPAITSAKSDIRRIIYCEMASTDEHDDGFEDRLWEEGGAFLSHCVDSYLEAHPNHGPIATDQNHLVNVIDENEQHLENFFAEYFQLTDKASFATAKEIKIAAEDAWPRSRKTYREFLAWLKRVHGIECTNLPEDGARERRYYGMGRIKIVQPTKSSERLNFAQ